MKFCVYLTTYTGNKLPPFYIGSSDCDRVNDGYHGSVKSRRYRKIWESELQKNPDKFVTRIISIHLTRYEAFIKEEKLHRQLKVIRNPMYINMTYANRRFCTIDGLSEETRKKIGTSNTGKKMPPRGPEYRDKQRISHLGKKDTLQTIIKKSIAMTGVEMPVEYLKIKHCQPRKMIKYKKSCSKKIIDPHINQQIYDMWIAGITRSQIKSRLQLRVSLATISNIANRIRNEISLS